MTDYLGKYREVRLLNRGSYGVVMLVEDPSTMTRYAAKRVPLTNADLKEAAYTEIEVLSALKHPHILKLVEHFHDPTTNELVLILEYCHGGDLHEAIRSGINRGRAFAGSRERLRRLLLQLVDALEYAHSRGIYHRDIKPENILLGRGNTAKLGDWGLSSTTQICTEFGVGSEQYMAPECFDPSAKSYDGAKADIWALGIVLLNALFGRNPFKTANERDRLFTDFASCRETLYDVFPALSHDVFAVLRHCLTIDPSNRSLAAMRTALQEVKIWTTDDELEILSKSWEEERSVVAITQPRAPFRVPTAHNRRSLSPVRSSWDRRKMYTPPASTSHLPHLPHLHNVAKSPNFPHQSQHQNRRRSRRHSSHHRPNGPGFIAEEAEEEAVAASYDATSYGPRGVSRWDRGHTLPTFDDASDHGENEHDGVFAMDDLDAALAGLAESDADTPRSSGSTGSQSSSASEDSNSLNTLPITPADSEGFQPTKKQNAALGESGHTLAVA